jgi:hypothetical protein
VVRACISTRVPGRRWPSADSSVSAQVRFAMAVASPASPAALRV